MSFRESENGKIILRRECIQSENVRAGLLSLDPEGT